MLKKKYNTLISSCVSIIFEWYDYALFAHFALIISNNFFPNSNLESNNLLRAFAVFAVGYLMRPIGGLLFGIMGDKIGRKEALAISIICMALPTTIIGLLPSYSSIGIWSVVLVTAARILQGLSIGGACTGSMCFLIEHTFKTRRGVVGSLLMSSICIGILLGSLVSYLVQHILTIEQFALWGWRIPFLLGSPIVFVGIYIKNNTSETPIFNAIKKEHKIVSTPLKKVLQLHWQKILVSIMINITGSVIFYFEAVYIANYMKSQKLFEQSTIDNLSKICYLLMTFMTILSGWISDLFGRKKIYAVNLILITFSIIIITAFLESNNIYLVVLSQLIVAAFTAFYIGPEPALQCELYPDDIRNTALSISYNVSTSIFGGTAPYIFEYFAQSTGSLSYAAYYIIICSFISMLGLYFYYKIEKSYKNKIINKLN